MSSYLQRMVSQAQQGALSSGSGSGIRPLVRSLFSSQASAAFGEVHEDASAAPTGLHRGRVSDRQAPAWVVSRASSDSTKSGDFLRSDTQRDSNGELAEKRTESERFSPLMPQSSLAENSERSQPLSEAVETPSRSAGKVGPETPVTLRVAEALREPMPLMPRQARVAVLPSVAAIPTSVPAASDEIHINIGRIEVTALPLTPAQRPAPRAPRRAFSLDDYLRKTDGRA